MDIGQVKDFMRKMLRGLLIGAIMGGAVEDVAGQSIPTGDPVVQAIWDEGMGEGSQVGSLASSLLDSIGPRLMGTPGFDRAGDWVLETYAKWGIEGEKQEYGTWTGWERGYTHIDLLTPRQRTLEGTMLAWSPGTDGPVEGPVVMMPEFQNAAELEAWIPTAAGKFVAVSFSEPTCRAPESWAEYATEETNERVWAERNEASRMWNVNFGIFLSNNGPARLEEAGALGLLTGRWSQGWGVDKVFQTFSRNIPSIHLSCEDYGLVTRLANNGQGPTIRLDAQARHLGDVPAFNIVGRIPGTELPNEYVLLSAHLDSWDGASGATDNGSGTIMMMEAMRLLKKHYPNPRRTILVGNWGGEEQGLIGSAAFATDNPEVVDGLQVALNQDNGTWRIDYIRMQGFLNAGSHFARWFESVPDEIKSHITLDLPGIPERGGSDHMSFICKPAPGFRLQSNYPDYRQYTWHTNRDTYDKLVFDDLKNNATLAALLAYAASEDAERLTVGERVLVGRDAQPGQFPQCRPPRRSAGQ